MAKKTKRTKEHSLGHGKRRRLKKAGTVAGHFFLYAAAAVLVLLALAYAGARWYLPQLAEKKAALEERLSRLTAHRIRIEKLSTFWDGLSPGAHVQGIRVYPEGAAVPAIRLSELRLSVAVWPLAWGELRIDTLRITRPRLSFERLPDGRLQVAGFDPIEPEAGTQGDEFLRWLFRQQRLEIENGEFQWVDRRYSAVPLVLTDVNLTLRNDGARHRLGLSANLPAALCAECRAVADVTGNPLLGEPFKGEIYLRAQGLDLQQLPGIAREQLPAGTRGRLDVELWTQWSDSRPRGVIGQIKAAGLSLPVPGLVYPLSLREAEGDLRFSASDDEWRLDLTELKLGLRKPAWSAGRVRVEYSPKRQQLHVDHVDLNDLAAVAAELAEQDPGDNAALARWRGHAQRIRELSPSGRLRELALTLRGAWGEPQHYRLQAAADQLRVTAVDNLPGVENLSGRLDMEDQRGEFRMASQGLRIDLPKHFRAPLPVGRASGRLQWSRGEDHWNVQSRDLAIDSEDGKGQGELALRVPDDGSGAHLRLQFKFRDGDVSHAARYYPVHDLEPDIRRWLDYAFVAGRVEYGTLRWEGRPADFPFRHGEGRFEIEGRVSQLVYRYLPGWEPVTDVQADVRIADRQVLVSGRGRQGQLAVDRLSVLADMVPEGAVRVGVRVSGPASEKLRILRAAKAQPGEVWKSFVPAGIEAEGMGALHLALHVPYGKEREQIAGEFQAVSVGVRVPEFGAVLENARGRVSFNADGPADGELSGTFLGGPAQLSMVTRGTDARRIAAVGSITAAGVGTVLGPSFVPFLSGTAKWSAALDIKQGVPTLTAELDSPNLNSRLPPPLYRPRGITTEKLIVKTERSTRDAHVVAVNAGQSISGRLVFGRAASGWSLSHGELRLGEGQAGFATNPGLALRLAVDDIDIDRWLPFRGEGTTGALPPILSRVSANVRRLDMFGRHYGTVVVDVARDGDGWSGTVDGSTASGKLQVRGRDDKARVEMDLAYLALPPKAEGVSTADGEDIETDPRRLPRVSLRAREFRVQHRNIGQLEFLAEPRADGWRVSRFDIARADTKFNANGLWRIQEGLPFCEVELTLESSDFGATAAVLGVPEQLEGGKGKIRATLSWAGSPAAARASNVSGLLKVQAKDGRFLQLKQGAARLFGILDISSIGHYLLGNFSPIFGSGFGYDAIDGSFELLHGDATTHDLNVKGASARIGINGRIGLAAEDFDMVLVIDPQISDALTLGSWYFLGPQVAATVLAVQKLFKKQIEKGTRVSYLVRGPWAKPTIEPLPDRPDGNAQAP